MLDIVATHQDKLALPVERERVDQAETRLARPAAARKTQTMAKQSAIGDNQPNDRDQRESGERCELQRRTIAQRKTS
jgi:hypothetical protein